MKRKIIGVIIAVLMLSTAAFADKLVFTEFGLSHGKVFSPARFADNTTGLFDTAVFDARAGVNILKWGDVYLGGAFNFYVDRGNNQQHYTFFPVYGGIRANIMPDWVVFPSVFFEYGKAISNHHWLFMGYKVVDNPWLADYYNFGLCVNWNVADIAILQLRVERPAITSSASLGGEFHIIKTGLAWKIYY